MDNASAITTIITKKHILWTVKSTLFFMIETLVSELGLLKYNYIQNKSIPNDVKMTTMSNNNTEASAFKRVNVPHFPLCAMLPQLYAHTRTHAHRERRTRTHF